MDDSIGGPKPHLKLHTLTGTRAGDLTVHHQATIVLVALLLALTPVEAAQGDEEVLADEEALGEYLLFFLDLLFLFSGEGQAAQGNEKVMADEALGEIQQKTQPR